MLEIESSASGIESSDVEWGNCKGEAPDGPVVKSLRLAHSVVDKFPDLGKRYPKFIGAVPVGSTALVVLASMAINMRIDRGESSDQILAEITADEVENAVRHKPLRPKAKAHRFIH